MVLINLQTFNVSILKKNKIIYIYIYNNYYFCILKTKDNINLMNSTFLKLDLKKKLIVGEKLESKGLE